MITNVTGRGPAAGASGVPPDGGSSPASAPEDLSAVTKEMFLKLLVAQIQNQNPLKPIDGVEFLSQLATLTSVEQLFAIRAELEAIRAANTSADPPAGPPPATQLP